MSWMRKWGVYEWGSLLLLFQVVVSIGIINTHHFLSGWDFYLSVQLMTQRDPDKSFWFKQFIKHLCTRVGAVHQRWIYGHFYCASVCFVSAPFSFVMFLWEVNLVIVECVRLRFVVFMYCHQTWSTSLKEQSRCGQEDNTVYHQMIKWSKWSKFSIWSIPWWQFL